MHAAVLARAAVVVAVLVIGWRVLHVNAVVYGDTNRPTLKVPEQGAARTDALREAVRSNPAEVAALVEWGQARQSAGELGAARGAYAAALAIAPIDRGVLTAAAALDAAEGRIGEAVGRVDRLVDYYPQTREWAFPLLVQWLPQPHARAALDSLAARRTSWMGSFITFACGRADAVLVGSLVSRRAAAGLAQPQEIGCATDRLRSAGHVEAAYQVWLNTLARDRLADVGHVFNGSFEHAPSGVGFDWIADERSPAHLVEYPITHDVEGRRALRVTWSGKRSTGAPIRQHLAVPAGRYLLSGRSRLEGLQSVQGIQWIVRCAGAASPPLGASQRFVGSGEWQPFSFAVQVPHGCRGQLLQLQPVGLGEATTFVSGKAWFDDLRLARAD